MFRVVSVNTLRVDLAPGIMFPHSKALSSLARRIGFDIHRASIAHSHEPHGQHLRWTDHGMDGDTKAFLLSLAGLICTRNRRQH